ncbi:class I SAM-dependent methyltransferase [Variovorax sp. J22R193]|uniref:class I SAM-dependent methyltransferase n=1 Tax=Variovorax fucosicus TaxID=3053517 RepID=UPI0025765A11|nr:class I SAM-dependent methyltransferase [Variovorax sp. J22R193]MDM0041874.1 class I SAM-dependent methyltransferase [Variovorax sp. J22R193]
MDHTAAERSKYQKIWTVDGYRVRSPGLRHLPGALEWMQPEAGASITDWGSGSGQASDAMHKLGFDVRMVDIAANAYRGDLKVIEACLWELPEDMPATDYGFCADVMEHLPPEKVEAVLQQIAARTRKKCYFQIALFRDHTFTEAGPLHLSVFPPEWWEQKVLASFKTAEFKLIGRKHLLAVATP